MKKIEFYRELSKLKKTGVNKAHLEQYRTDIETAYELTSFIASEIGIEGKTVADLGCGDGILGIAAGLMHAGNVDMYDIDKNAVSVAEENITLLGLKNARAIDMDVFDVKKRYDIAVSNPPFGLQSNFDVKAFIKKAEELSDNLFFVYKDNKAIRKTAEDNGLQVLKINDLKIEKSLPFHKKDYYTLPVVIVYKTGGS